MISSVILSTPAASSFISLISEIRRRPGFDMEWGRVMEQRVRDWLKKTEFTTFEPGEKTVDDASLRRVMAACAEQQVDAQAVQGGINRGQRS